MNPLLSLSFLSTSPVAAGAEPALHAAGATMDETAGAKSFGHLLNQSGEQQMADGQSFAGIIISGKNKRTASMEGQPTGRPQDSIPPVVPPEAELILADENHAGTLLGLLDLASQTRLQLTTGKNENGQATSASSTVGLAPEETTRLSAGDEHILEGKKLARGEWFILPVDPKITAAGIADSDVLTAIVSKKSAGTSPSDTTKQSKAEQAAAALLAGLDKGADGSEEQSATAADSAAVKILNSSQQNNSAITAAQQVLANQASEVDLAAAQANTDSEVDTAGTTTKSVAEVLPDKMVTQSGNDKLLTAGTVATQASDLTEQTQAAVETEAELAARQQAEATGADKEWMTEHKSGVSAEPATVKIAAPNQTSEVVNTVTEAAELNKSTGIFQSAATTIFESSDKAVLNPDDGKPGSVLASAAAVAESQSAKQQRGGASESYNQAKQALEVANDTASQQSKGELGSQTIGARAESSLSGFGSIVSQASQSHSEAAMARLEAAVTGTQQTAERAKAQSVNKSVAEQLKQVNLLAQNAAGQLKDRINMMVRQNINVADIRLDPADLGQMQIRVNLQQEQASVQFIVQQQHAKELLEQQMPRLREMLQQQGIQLGEGHVQQQRQGDSQASARQGGNTDRGQGSGEQPADEKATAVQLDVKLSERIVDYYA